MDQLRIGASMTPEQMAEAAMKRLREYINRIAGQQIRRFKEKTSNDA